MLRRSEYEIGEFLVDGQGRVFIHDGYVNGDGYGCIIGMVDASDHSKVEKQSDWGNYMRYPVDHVASDEEKEKLIRRIMYTETIKNY